MLLCQSANRRPVALALGVWWVVGVAANAIADDEHKQKSPMATAKGQKYPRGDRGHQEYLRPEGERVEFAAPGVEAVDVARIQERVSAMVGRRPVIRDLQPVPRYTVPVGVSVAPPAVREPGAEPLNVAARVVQRTAQRAGPGGLARDRSGKSVTSFTLQYKGIPFSKFSSSTALVRGDGSVARLRERNIPRLETLETEPTVERQAALDLGMADSRTAMGLENQDLASSTPTLEIWVDGERDGHLTWAFTVSSRAGQAYYVRKYWVEATGEPTILYSEDQVYHAHQGKVTGTIWGAKTSPFGTPTTGVPLAFARVRSGMGTNGQTTQTRENGTYTLDGSGTTSIRAELTGDFCRIDNVSGQEMTRSATGSDGVAIDLDFNAMGDQELAQVTAYFWTNVVGLFTQEILGFGRDHRLARLPTNVNINFFVPNVGDSCNAFWNGSSLNFFVSGGGCPNTAFGDVVMHEYGHGVDQRLGGIQDGGYSEGFGDSLSILILRDPIVGRDFFGEGEHLRNATDVVKLPDVEGGEPHTVGRVYGGFVWELVQRLKTKFGGDEERAFAVATDLVLGAAAMDPLNTADAVFNSFLIDDDDDDLDNGSPHFDELAAAADSREIPHPSRNP